MRSTEGTESNVPVSILLRTEKCTNTSETYFKH